MYFQERTKITATGSQATFQVEFCFAQIPRDTHTFKQATGMIESVFRLMPHPITIFPFGHHSPRFIINTWEILFFIMSFMRSYNQTYSSFFMWSPIWFAHYSSFLAWYLQKLRKPAVLHMKTNISLHEIRKYSDRNSVRINTKCN